MQYSGVRLAVMAPFPAVPPLAPECGTAPLALTELRQAQQCHLSPHHYKVSKAYLLYLTAHREVHSSYHVSLPTSLRIKRFFGCYKGRRRQSCQRHGDLKPWRKISLFVLSLCIWEDREQGKDLPRKKWEERKLDSEVQDRK